MKIKGCGAIFFTEHNNQILFLLGIDYKNRLTDFGGKREKNETCKECAIRESYEETSNSIGDLNYIKKLFNNNCTKIYFNTYLCYFIKINYDPDIPTRYINYMNKYKHLNINGFFEFNSLTWITLNDLYKIYFTKKIVHDRTRYILKKYFNKSF